MGKDLVTTRPSVIDDAQYKITKVSFVSNEVLNELKSIVRELQVKTGASTTLARGGNVNSSSVDSIAPITLPSGKFDPSELIILPPKDITKSNKRSRVNQMLSDISAKKVCAKSIYHK